MLHTEVPRCLEVDILHYSTDVSCHLVISFQVRFFTYLDFSCLRQFHLDRNLFSLIAPDSRLAFSVQAVAHLLLNLKCLAVIFNLLLHHLFGIIFNLAFRETVKSFIDREQLLCTVVLRELYWTNISLLGLRVFVFEIILEVSVNFISLT